MKRYIYILCLCLPAISLAQGSIHLKGQSYLELCWQANLEYEPGLSFMISAGKYLSPNSGFQLGIAKNLLYAFEKEPLWQKEDFRDSVLYNRLIRKAYNSLSLLALYEHMILKNKDRLFLKGVIGAELGREGYGDQSPRPMYGPMLGAELQLFIATPLSLTTRYSFHYHPESSFPTKSQLQLGIRLSINPN